MKSELTEYRVKADRLLLDYEHASQSVKDEKLTLEKAKEELTDTEEAHKLVQEVARICQQTAHSQIAGVVTRCLKAVDYDYEFKIAFQSKRNRTEARLLFIRNGKEVDPTMASGVGSVEVAAFALRVACLLLSRPRLRRLLVLDEPFSRVDTQRIELVRDLLLSLTEDMGVQIIMVTHNRKLMIGKVIDLEEILG